MMALKELSLQDLMSRDAISAQVAMLTCQEHDQFLCLCSAREIREYLDETWSEQIEMDEHDAWCDAYERIVPAREAFWARHMPLLEADYSVEKHDALLDRWDRIEHKVLDAVLRRYGFKTD